MSKYFHALVTSGGTICLAWTHLDWDTTMHRLLTGHVNEGTNITDPPGSSSLTSRTLSSFDSEDKRLPEAGYSSNLQENTSVPGPIQLAYIIRP
ncbi:hypothetical protein BRARA_D01516 [Brassica rapa]|uniref:Uncharacterized protein n=1 Tax=Brassica campestris TaxID=3711 RepID=A0A397ZL45_BRACM|nr:hypothetical protein BRARA_D01516 [Brassica rapa]